MNKRTFAVLVAVVTFVTGVALAKLSLFPQPTNQIKKPQLGSFKVTGPYEAENLTVFLIHGPDQPTRTAFIPLQEAMERKLVIVHETSDVNELAIENVSSTEEVFVQAGDIVKGGQQDRVLAVDLILPAHSGKIPIDAFCVEQERWTQRGGEQADQFSLSPNMVATKDLKIATRAERSQSKVWDEVASAQRKLSAGVASNVRSEVSESSLQLSMENESVRESVAKYLKTLRSIVEGRADVIGFAFAINSKLNSAEIYPSSDMFKRFWPRLLEAAAIEALAERRSEKKKEVVAITTASELLGEGELGVQSQKEVTKRTHMIKREGERSLFFETRDMNQSGAWIHRSYLAR